MKKNGNMEIGPYSFVDFRKGINIDRFHDAGNSDIANIVLNACVTWDNIIGSKILRNFEHISSKPIALEYHEIIFKH